MCGRFTLASTPDRLLDLLELSDLPAVPPRYNVAPSQPVLAARLTAGGTREGVLLRWGLVPRWHRGDKVQGFANARADTVAEKPAFRDAFRKRRCLIAADGFYEWAAGGRVKQPWHFRLHGGGPFAFAGLWESWASPAGPLETCCLLTTDANGVVATAHDRMPVILPDRRAAAARLDPTTPVHELYELLVPLPDDRVEARMASTAVNNARNEGPELLAAAGGLFGA